MKAPIGVLTPVTINDSVLAIVMVLDLAEPSQRCGIWPVLGIVCGPGGSCPAVHSSIGTPVAASQTFIPEAVLDAAS